jgi:acyl transferase domain-containing protein/acyl-CoA synthetase (AMP-forming)/AMP-acid ligase II
MVSLFTPPSQNILQVNSLVALLRWRASHQSDRVAYTFLQDGEVEQAVWTYSQLDWRARTIAAQLQHLRLSGQRALLLYPQSLEFIAAFFGCLYAGVVAVPAYPPRRNHHWNRLQGIIQDATATAILTTGEISSNLSSYASQAPELEQLHWIATDTLWNHKSPDQACPWQDPQVDSNSLAFLQYTSGSTGTPKGVMVTHGNLLYNVADIDQNFQHGQDSSIVTWLPTFHDMGLIYGVLQPLYNGIPCYMMSPVAFLQRPARWLQAISHYRATHSGGPNFAYDLCVQKIKPEQRKQLDLSHWAIAFNGAEPVRAETLEQFASFLEPCGFKRQALTPCYGMAETTLKVVATDRPDQPLLCAVRSEQLAQHRVMESQNSQNPDQSELVLVGCGRPVLETRVAIVHPDDGTHCQPDQVGEIWVAGPTVAQGYWQRPETTQETFQAYLTTGDGPFLRTGDLGFLKDGELFVTGRIKDLVIINGLNYYPQDIEQTVADSHAALRSGGSAAFAVEVDGQERLVVVQEVERTALRQVDFDQVVETIRSAVYHHHDLPVHSIVLIKPSSLPKTSSGKVQRWGCKAAFLDGTLNGIKEWNTVFSERANSDDPSIDPRENQGQDLRQDSPGIAATIKPEDLKPSPQPKAVETIASWLITAVAKTLQLSADAIDPHRSLAYYGLASRETISLLADLGDWLGQDLSPTLAYDYPSIAALSQYLGRSLPESPPKSSATHQQQDSRSSRQDPIAIIGLGCRFPQAANPEAFWQLLRQGKDGVVEIPPNRWNIDDFYDPNPLALGKMNYRQAGLLDQVDQFDSQFFGIAPKEAISMDPQQRLLLEVVWEALEQGGQAPERLSQSSTGVFVGISSNDYGQLQLGHPEQISDYTAVGNAHNMVPNRLSYILNLQGPSVAVDTACSASLVAVHLANQSLQNRECNMAIAAGVNLILTPGLSIALAKAQMTAPDGRCKTFDAAADGYGRGEGCGVVILKRLSDALRDGDRVLALLRGSAVNEDGHSNGLTAPSGLAQQAVIRQALDKAGVSPGEISYVEAHGTGTRLGDPIEVDALKAVLLPERSPQQPCYLGSVKANIGHLEAAAGIAGLIKTVLALQHQQIPPQAQLKQINPLLQLEETPLEIAREITPWIVGPNNDGKNRGTTEHPALNPEPRRYAGVSSFGFGGTNAHVILEEFVTANLALAPSNPSPPTPSPQLAENLAENSAQNPSHHLLVLSGHKEKAVQSLINRYTDHLNTDPSLNLDNVCFTASTGRSHFDHRVAVVADSMAHFQQELRAYQGGQETGNWFVGKNKLGQKKVAFLFTGQGSQYLHMGRELYQSQPLFRQVLNRCDQILQSYLDQPLLSVLYPELNNPTDASPTPSSSTPDDGQLNLLDQTAYIQPALFAVEYALAQVWLSWGIEPDVVMGHSVGEYVAACVAGVFSLEDGLKLMAQRGALIQSLPANGAMVAVLADPAWVAELIEPYDPQLSIAAINGPGNLVISGELSAIETVLNQFDLQGIKHKRLSVSHAFHSALMEPILRAFAETARTVTYHFPQIDLISNVTGTVATAVLTEPDYWVNHIRQPVQFAQGIATLQAQACDVWLEIGPRPTLLAMGAQCMPYPEEGDRNDARKNSNPIPVSLPSLRPQGSDWQVLLQSLAQLYVQGLGIDWPAFHQGNSMAEKSKLRVDLPTYPFQRQRYWLDEVSPQHPAHLHGDHPASTVNLESRAQDSKPLAVESDLPQEVQISPIWQDLKRAYPEDRFPRLIQYLQAELARVLGLDLISELPDPETGFAAMGLDSLMAMDLKRRVENNLHCQLSPTLAFNYPTIGSVATHLIQDVLVFDSASPAGFKSGMLGSVSEALSRSKALDQALALELEAFLPPTTTTTTTAGITVEQLQALSDAETETLLLNTLDTLPL